MSAAARPILDADGLKAAVKARGSHWFDKDTLFFFRSRVSREIYPGGGGRVYFVSSEQPPECKRAYSVRLYSPGLGRSCISTEGEFMGHPTWAAAHRAAAEAAAADRALHDAGQVSS